MEVDLKIILSHLYALNLLCTWNHHSVFNVLSFTTVHSKCTETWFFEIVLIPIKVSKHLLSMIICYSIILGFRINTEICYTFREHFVLNSSILLHNFINNRIQLIEILYFCWNAALVFWIIRIVIVIEQYKYVVIWNLLSYYLHVR